MKSQKHWLVVALFFLMSGNLAGAAALPDSLKIGDTPLLLNGSGARTKYLMEMYVGGLYLKQPNTNPAAILAADELMAIRLQITSGLVSQEKMVAAINEGFQNSTGGQTAAIEAEIQKFRLCFRDKIVKGDVFDIVYTPGKGVLVVKNGKLQGVVPGLAFKQAVFGIWLSDNPADSNLRVAMLQGRK